jgi:hypothetical protein
MKLLQRDTHKDDQSEKGTPHEANTDVSVNEDMFHHFLFLLNDSFVLIVLSIHMELRPSAWALQNSPCMQTTS